MLAIFLAIIVAIAGGLGGMVFASNSAAPGDALYGVDRAVENIQYGLAGMQGRSTLALRFAQERYEEVNTLIDEGDDSDELLVGLDEAIAAVEALLADETLSPEARTAIQAQLDYLIELRTQLDPGTMVELEIETDDGTVTVDVNVEGESEVDNVDDGEVDNVDDGEVDNVDDGEVDNVDDGEVDNVDDGEVDNVDDGNVDDNNDDLQSNTGQTPPTTIVDQPNTSTDNQGQSDDSADDNGNDDTIETDDSNDDHSDSNDSHSDEQDGSHQDNHDQDDD
jgi:hypothetical protein